MPPLDPLTDFADDGGTRAWRANQATWGARRTIEVSPPPWYRSPGGKLALMSVGLAGLAWLAIAALILTVAVGAIVAALTG